MSTTRTSELTPSSETYSTWPPVGPSTTGPWSAKTSNLQAISVSGSNQVGSSLFRGPTASQCPIVSWVVGSSSGTTVCHPRALRSSACGGSDGASVAPGSIVGSGVSSGAADGEAPLVGAPDEGEAVAAQPPRPSTPRPMIRPLGTGPTQ